MRLGLLGGTFDPVHLSHLILAEWARDELRLDKVIWIPGGRPPHKAGMPITVAEHRLAMVRLATADHRDFEVSTYELEQPGPNYTLHTVQHFRDRHPDDELTFLIGADSLHDLPTWHRPEEILQLCRMAAISRPGYDFTGLEAALPAAWLERIDRLTAPTPALSSTEIRERVRRGRSLRYLVPDPVVEYIRERSLYRGGVERPE